jgi:tetratricopeptide (TPR) repeat protein
MELIHFRDAFFYSLFPELEKGDAKAIKDVLTKFYRVGIYEPKIVIEENLVRVVVDLNAIAPMTKEHKRIISLCEKGKFQEAKSHLLPLIRQYPAHSELHRLLGQIESESGNQEEAIHSLIDALRWDPSNAFALIMMGNIFLRIKEEPETAMRYYNQALVANPNDYLTANNIAATYMQMGQFDQAEIFLRKALNSNPDFPNTHHGFGLYFEETGELYPAFESFFNAMKVNQKKDELYKQSLHKLFDISQKIVDSNSVEEVVSSYLQELIELQRKDIKIEKSDSIPYVAKIEYAELYNRDHHLIKYLPSRPAIAHLVMHELTHLKFAVEAREANKYQLITSDRENKNGFKIQIHSFTSNLVEKGIIAGGGGGRRIY